VDESNGARRGRAGDDFGADRVERLRLLSAHLGSVDVRERGAVDDGVRSDVSDRGSNSAVVTDVGFVNVV
jgi:hypothetical protein